MGKAKMTISEISIPQDKVVSTGGADAGTIGHEFTMRAKLDVAKRTMGRLSGDGIEEPTLEWKEIIDWFELIAPDTWLYAANSTNGATVDMFKKNPKSNTFKLWSDARHFLAIDPTNNPQEEFTKFVKEGASLEAQDKLAKHWIAENGNVWTVSVTDRPAMGLKPTAASGGGGGASLVTSNSRRRVIYFDLGFGTTRVTATQVLETINGVPTIHRFFVPAISREEVNNNTNLTLWRSQTGQRRS